MYFEVRSEMLEVEAFASLLVADERPIDRLLQVVVRPACKSTHIRVSGGAKEGSNQSHEGH